MLCSANLRTPSDGSVCRCARDRQGHVASRWPSATLDGRCAPRPITTRSGRGDGRWHVEQGDRNGSQLVLTQICPYNSYDFPIALTPARRPLPEGYISVHGHAQIIRTEC